MNRQQRRAAKSKMKDGVPEEWDDEKRNAFADWISDDRNFARVMRELERQGLFESYIGPDGKLWARRTDKPAALCEPDKDEEKLS
jgi:hypothetical protein